MWYFRGRFYSRPMRGCIVSSITRIKLATFFMSKEYKLSSLYYLLAIIYERSLISRELADCWTLGRRITQGSSIYKLYNHLRTTEQNSKRWYSAKRVWQMEHYNAAYCSPWSTYARSVNVDALFGSSEKIDFMIKYQDLSGVELVREGRRLDEHFTICGSWYKCFAQAERLLLDQLYMCLIIWWCLRNKISDLERCDELFAELYTANPRMWRDHIWITSGRLTTCFPCT